MNRRFVAGTAAGAVLALSLTGCLGDSDPKKSGGNGGVGGAAGNLSAMDVLVKTSQKSGQTDTLKADMNVQTSAPQGNVKMHMVMQMRLRPQVAFDMVMDQMSIDGQAIAGGVGKMHMILVDKTLYMKSPALKAGNKPWVALSLTELSKRGGQNIDQLLQSQRQVDPAEQTKMLTGSKNVREIGSEQVEGVQTTHYAGSMTPEEALSRLTPEQRAAQEKSLQKSGVTKMDFEVWVDGQNLPRKMIMKLAGRVPVTTSVVYRDYGKPVTVVAPPASQVGPMPGTISPRT